MLGACSTRSTTSPDGAPGDANQTGAQKLNHLVVIVLENWSFDSLYGEFPGADGLANVGAGSAQVDATGTPYDTLPQNETHLPQTLPNAPFALDA